MTKDCGFLVPKPKKIDFNKLVTEILQPFGRSKYSSSKRTKKLDSPEISKTKICLLDRKIRKYSDGLHRYRLQAHNSVHNETMAYIQKKITESGFANANIYISDETLQKITEKLLRSGSIDPDQKTLKNTSLSLPNLKISQERLDESVPLGTSLPESFSLKIHI
ncbi:unnamed protein product [Moneuplotes crassus]|uniref:Uncharacterized protein n=1 Tax=Euplotes crassus TaxID=5936 RepID=A0AAD1XZC2_EUPCR|nr:unnamed protein product [Moneuplotes crassus]